jgi:hypothetical protein
MRALARISFLRLRSIVRPAQPEPPRTPEEEQLHQLWVNQSEKKVTDTKKSFLARQ